MSRSSVRRAKVSVIRSASSLRTTSVANSGSISGAGVCHDGVCDAPARRNQKNPYGGSVSR